MTRACPASALALTLAHTPGEFGVVPTVGGNIGRETRTIAIPIYDRVEAFANQAAAAGVLAGASLELRIYS